MKIIYINDGTIIGAGDVTENDTHYILNNTYYDKNLCFVLEINLPENFKIQNWKYINGELVEMKNTIITKQDFVNRLNDEEWAKIADYENIVESMNITQDEQKFLRTAIKAWLLKMNLLENIDLNDAKVINMGNIFVQYGFVSADRIKEILS